MELGGWRIGAAGQCLELFDSAHLAWVVGSLLFRCSTAAIVSRRDEVKPLLLGGSSETPSDLILRQNEKNEK